MSHGNGLQKNCRWLSAPFLAPGHQPSWGGDLVSLAGLAVHCQGRILFIKAGISHTILPSCTLPHSIPLRGYTESYIVSRSRINWSGVGSLEEWQLEKFLGSGDRSLGSEMRRVLRRTGRWNFHDRSSLYYDSGRQ